MATKVIKVPDSDSVQRKYNPVCLAVWSSILFVLFVEVVFFGCYLCHFIARGLR